MKNLVLSWVLMMTVVSTLFAQTRQVTGKVTSSEDGSTIPGVSVSIKGSTSGTTTSADGTYKISVGNGASLVFTSVGYLNKTMAVGNASTINVILEVDSKVLSEVVVTAGGVLKDKKSLGYATATITNDQLIVGRTTNPVNALAAKVAGVRIASSNGMVGSSTAIFIRGFTTFTGSNQPLFVVDGVPIDNGGGTNALQNGVSNSNRAIDINQEDIENLSILKGPAAAALYGSRAANGAILITTKKGKTGHKNSVVLVLLTTWLR